MGTTSVRLHFRASIWVGLALWLLAGMPGAVTAALAASVDVVLSGNSAVYAEAASAIRAVLHDRDVSQVYADQLRRPVDSPRIVVAVGGRALRQALSTYAGVPIIATLVTRQTYESTVAAYPERRDTSAVYLDQPYPRQLALVRELLPKSQRIGTLVTPEFEREFALLQTAARAQGMTPVAERLPDPGNPYPALRNLLPEVDALLALPDPNVYSPAGLSNILLSAYRMKRPLIGISPSFVRAGALAAVYSTPAQMGRQAGEIAARVLAGAPLPPPAAPEYFSVGVNATVAASLDVVVDGEGALLERLKRAERGS